MVEYVYKCPECGAVYEVPKRADYMDFCRTAGCDGKPKRRYGAVHYNIVKLRDAR